MPLAEGVNTNASSLAGSFSASGSGTIAWRSGRAGRRQLIWLNRAGQRVGTLGLPDDVGLLHPELSPDGKQVAITRLGGGVGDIWLQEGTRLSRFTFDPAEDRFSIWSPDRRSLVFASTRKGTFDLYRKPSDGSCTEGLLLESPDAKRPNSWSPDGRFNLYASEQNNGDLMLLPLSDTRKPFPFLSTPFNEQQVLAGW